jgi:hypothetical protein
MTIQYKGTDITLTAAENLSSYQYRFVHQASDTTVDLLDSTAEFPLGVLQNAPESGELAVVRISGTSKLVMNAAVTVGTLLKAEYVGAADNGKGDKADTDKDIMRGVCIRATGAEDDVGGILLTVDKISIVSSISASPSASPSASISSSPSSSPSASVSSSPS